MKQKNWILSLTLLSWLTPIAYAGDCGCEVAVDDCGCNGHSGKYCELKVGTKKIKVTCYGCECDAVCLPGPSKKGCTHCENICEDGTCGCDCECGHKPQCKVRWTDWCPAPCGKVYDRKKLVKYEAEKEVPDYKWVVVDPCKAPADAPKAKGDDKPPQPPVPTPASASNGRRSIRKPAPANARVGDVYPLTDTEIEQIKQQHVQMASHMADAGATATKRTVRKPAQPAVNPSVNRKPAASTTVVASDTPWALFGN
jgi:hypothetical protein